MHRAEAGEVGQIFLIDGKIEVLPDVDANTFEPYGAFHDEVRDPACAVAPCHRDQTLHHLCVFA